MRRASLQFFRVVEGEPTPRNQLLKAVYHKWHAAVARTSLRRSPLLESASVADFKAFLDKSGGSLSKQHDSRPYRIDPELMVKLTTRSCELEGNVMTDEDVSIVGSSIAESPMASGALPSPPHALYQQLQFRSAVHINEAYLGQALLLSRDTFYVTKSEFLRLHEVLDVSLPRQVTGQVPHPSDPGFKVGHGVLPVPRRTSWAHVPVLQVARDTASKQPGSPLPAWV